MSGIASLPYEVVEQPLVPINGLASIKRASQLLSDFGRNGDTYVVHAKEGETVIPMEVLNNNPKLKTMLFSQMRDMDLDPERYIIGNELNSINPVTGQPEFFLKKLFKGLKKVVKKVAPIVLPIAAPFLLPTMPLFLSSGIGSFAGSLIGGAKPKDALRNAVLAGGMAGLGNMAFGQGGFGGSAIEAGITKGDYDITKMFGGETPSPLPKGSFTKAEIAKNQLIPPEEKGILGTLKENVVDPVTNVYEIYLDQGRKSIQATDAEILSKIQKDQELWNAVEAQNKKIAEQAGQTYKAKPFTADISKVRKSLSPNVFQKYGPMAGLGLASLYGLDKAGIPIFSAGEEEGEGEYVPTGYDLYLANKGKYGFDNFYGSNPYYKRAATGGEIVGPGTSTSDSIPALLSDGEFVMNAKAVRGMGGGDRKKGASRMYAMMKQFEGRA